MANEVHNFMTGPLWLKLKTDVADFRLFNRHDLVAAAYFHIRRLLLVRPGWMCRVGLETAVGPADLVLSLHGHFQSLLQLEFLLHVNQPSYFPAEELDGRMERLRRILAVLEKDKPGRAYLFGVFDTTESWLFPNETMYEKQACSWVPINCREFPRHGEWRAKWDKTARPSTT